MRSLRVDFFQLLKKDRFIGSEKEQDLKILGFNFVYNIYKLSGILFVYKVVLRVVRAWMWKYLEFGV